MGDFNVVRKPEEVKIWQGKIHLDKSMEEFEASTQDLRFCDNDASRCCYT